MVTEADARVLESGSTIVLVAGGHITPLAQDTLKARRISVVREGSDPDAADLAPVATIRTVAIAGDHTALALKAAIVQHLRSRGVTAHDLGTSTSDPVDYPDTAASAALAVARGEADAGDRDRRRRTRFDDRRQQGAGRSCRDVSQRDAGALCPAAQRRQRAGARRHARQQGRGRWRSSIPSSIRRCAKLATSGDWRRFGTWNAIRAVEGIRPPSR